jgi:hypothetical protein
VGAQLTGELVGDDAGCQRHPARQRFRTLAPVDGVDVVLDDFQRQVLVALEGQDEAQALDVVRGVLPVPGAGPLRRDEALLLEEADLRRRDLRELPRQFAQDLADVEDTGGGKTWSDAGRTAGGVGGWHGAG